MLERLLSCPNGVKTVMLLDFHLTAEGKIAVCIFTSIAIRIDVLCLTAEVNLVYFVLWR